MFNASQFTVPKAKPLPVFLLLDVSGSMNEVTDPENVQRTGQKFMSDGQLYELVTGGTSKIQLLNKAVKQMIDSLAAEEKAETEFLVSIIVFGDAAVQHIPPTNASSVAWVDMTADGSTALGAALSLAKNLIENKNVVPSRSYRPTLVLVSDGQPTDAWQAPMEALIKEGRSSKCFFMAMGIGEESNSPVLECFISQTPILAKINGRDILNTVFDAKDANNIHEFFRKVTMSVTARSKSQKPDETPESKKSDSPEEEEGYW